MKSDRLYTIAINNLAYYVGECIRENDAKATGPFIMGCVEAGF